MSIEGTEGPPMGIEDIARVDRFEAAGVIARRGRWPILVACLIGVVFVFWHIRNLMDVEDAVVYFAYFNNALSIHIPFYYGGYIALYTQLAAYIASFLTFPWQPFVYMCAALVIGVYFIQQLLVFVDDVLKAPIVSTILTVVLIALMVKSHGTFNLFVNLTYNIWIGWLGLYLRVLNGLRGRRAGVVTIGLGVLSAWSHSFAVVLILPLLGALVLPLAPDAGNSRGRDPRILIEFGTYLIAAVLFPLLFIEPGFPKPLDVPDIKARLLHMLFDSHSNTMLTIVIGVLLVVMALPPGLRGLKAVLRGQPMTRNDYLLPVLAFVGFGTVAIIFASGRVFIADKIWARYLFTPFLSLVLAGLVIMSDQPRVMSAVAGVESYLQRLIARPVGRLAGGLAVVMLLMVTSLLPWRTVATNVAHTIDTERFLIAAGTFRATCQDGAFIQAWDKWSIAVLCHRRDLPRDSEAVSLSEDHVTVWGGNGQSRTSDHPKAAVPMLFEPLDVMKLPGQ